MGSVLLSVHHTNYLLPTLMGNDGKILHGNRLECLEEGIDYIRKNEEAEFANINQVDSADLCREICYVFDECFHWTWKKEKSSCHLKSEILKTGFRQLKKNYVSGTMLNGCSNFPIENGTPLKCKQDYEILGAVADEDGNLVEIEVPYKKCQKKICPKLLFETLNDAIYFCYDKVIKIQEIVQIPPYLKPEIAALLRLGLNLTK